MKRHACLLGVLLVLSMVVTPAAAQVSDELKLTLEVIRADHQKIVANALKLTAEEGAVFWPIYYEYMAEASKIDAQYAEVVLNFIRNSETMSDEELTTSFHQILDLEQKVNDLDRKYFKIISEKLGTRKAVRFFQIENRLRTLVDSKLMQDIPIVR